MFIYREGATVNGTFSGVSPLSVTVRHKGKIATGDSVFVNSTSGTTYTATVVSDTSLQLSGFGGSISLNSGDRLVPSNSQPTLYSDDQGGASTGNPLTSDSVGRAACWMNIGAYEILISGGTPNLNAQLYQGLVTTGEAPAVNISGESDSSTAVANAEDTYFSLTTTGAKLKSWRNLGTEKAAIDKDGTGIFPRFGQTSTTTTGGAVRVIEGNVFPLTVAGVQAALDEVGAASGGTVYIPAQAGISVTNTSVKIPNRVRLMGFGAYGSTATFVAANTANVSAMVENKTQDGTQQYAYAEGISIDGNKSGGAVVSAGLKLKSIYLGSRLKDVRVTACSGNGMLIDGGASGVGLGQMIWDNLSITSCNDHNILITGPVIQIVAALLGVESVAAGKAQVKVTNATASASFGHQFIGMKFEGTNASDGLWLDGVANVTVQGLSDHGNGTANNLVKITGSTTGSDGSFCSGGHLFLGLHANLTTIIDDQVSGVTVGNAQSRFVPIYICPKQVQSGGNDQFTGQIVGVQYQRRGIPVASGTTITVGNGNLFHVTGAVQIDNVTGAARDDGRRITLKFDSTPTVRHNGGGTGNIRINGSSNFVATANSQLSLEYDHSTTTWTECGRALL